MKDLLGMEPNREECDLEERELEKNGLQFELTRRRFVQTAGVLSVEPQLGCRGFLLRRTRRLSQLT
jgi:xanthine dehydrogenase YagT iron-sulfur-binding subunit